MPRPGWSWLVVPLLILLTAAVYRPVADYGFVNYDDPQVVTDNPHVAPGLTTANARWAVTGFAAGHWEPLTWWSLQTDESLWYARPGALHVENVVLHAASVVLLFGGLTAATGAVGRSAVVAALFAVHPMHVESVAWITERRDALSTPPLLAAVWAYVVYARSTRWRRPLAYAAVLVLYALSLLAKATGMTLPLVLLLVDVWPLDRRDRWPWRVIEKLPLVAMAVPAAVLAVAAQRAVGATSTLSDLTPAMRLANALVTTCLYVAKLAVPTGLAVFYPHPGDRPLATVVAAALLLAGATAVAWRQRRRRPWLLFGWAAFLVVLAPTSGVAQSGAQAMADRYTYVPSIGLFVAIVWTVADAVRAPAVLAAATVAIVATLTVMAHRQVGYWRDTRTLFAHDDVVTGGNVVAALELGDCDYADGRLADAVRWYNRARLLGPDDARPYNNLGNCMLSAHDPAAAAGYYADAVRRGPKVAAFRVDLASALSVLPGHRADAIAQCRAAIAVDPSNAPARAALADLLARPPEPKR